LRFRPPGEQRRNAPVDVPWLSLVRKEHAEDEDGGGLAAAVKTTGMEHFSHVTTACSSIDRPDANAAEVLEQRPVFIVEVDFAEDVATSVTLSAITDVR